MPGARRTEGRDVVILKRIGAPVMGLALLLGLATFASRLWRPT